MGGRVRDAGEVLERGDPVAVLARLALDRPSQRALAGGQANTTSVRP
jgi:hypothetical protein